MKSYKEEIIVEPIDIISKDKTSLGAGGQVQTPIQPTHQAQTQLYRSI